MSSPATLQRVRSRTAPAARPHPLQRGHVVVPHAQRTQHHQHARQAAVPAEFREWGRGSGGGGGDAAHGVAGGWHGCGCRFSSWHCSLSSNHPAVLTSCRPAESGAPGAKRQAAARAAAAAAALLPGDRRRPALLLDIHPRLPDWAVRRPLASCLLPPYGRARHRSKGGTAPRVAKALEGVDQCRNVQAAQSASGGTLPCAARCRGTQWRLGGGERARRFPAHRCALHWRPGATGRPSTPTLKRPSSSCARRSAAVAPAIPSGP